MRDPDLVLQAEQAAVALERGWHRWRVVHGLAADPVPLVSSYVGYSLDEPWGQPRVVFGLAAEDAEQLAAMLERHDCFGPVHAAVAGLPGSVAVVALPGRRQPSGRLAGLAVPLPVPPQAIQPQAQSSAVVGQLGSARFQGRSGVVGQLGSAHRRPESRAGLLDTSALTEPDDWRYNWPARGTVDSRSESARAAIAVNGPGKDHEQDLGSGLDGGAVLSAELAASPDAGPLTQAASAARAEAEARIKAALQERRSAAGTQNPYADTNAEPAHVWPSWWTASDADGLSDTAYFLAAIPRPEVASGAFARPAIATSRIYPGVVQEAGPAGYAGAEFADTAEIHQPAVAAFRPRPELAAYLEAGPEPSPFFDSPEDPSSGTLTRRSRIARGYALPRMPRSKRPGATPGT
jgi:hypothetical protein